MSFASTMQSLDYHNFLKVRDMTWGHMAPEKNVSYKGFVRFCFTDHSHYGRQAIILLYDFPNLDGPYIHDFLFDKMGDYDSDDFEIGAIYEQQLTFRNYRFYYGKINQLLK